LERSQRKRRRREGEAGKYRSLKHLDRAGVPQTVAMKITGHKTASVYRRYNIVNHQDLQNAAAALEQSVKVSSKFSEIPAVASR